MCHEISHCVTSSKKFNTTDKCSHLGVFILASLPQLLRADRNIKIKLCSTEKFTATSFSLKIYNKILLISIFVTKVKFLNGFALHPLPPLTAQFR